MIRQSDLVDRVRHYDPGVDEDLLNRAYVFSMKAHGTQTRASGDPYFSHPLEVAGIVTDMRLDAATVATALLHDTVEDTVATLDQIQQQFGPQIAQLVDGVTKLSALEQERPTDEIREAENFRKLLLAMSHDIRVLLVKLADRLHNMRTLHFIAKPEKRKRIARETMDIYAPLAERIGMHEMKDELEDLAFKELNPEARESVMARLAFLRESGGDAVGRIEAELKETLAEQGLRADVSGREKRPYSVWRKMQRKNVSFEQLSDLAAFRIIVPEVADCYRALGAVHSRYAAVPQRFKDYISTPKKNRYQSIHTTVIGPERRRIEIQICTLAMHEIAEYGVAAHWHYKELGSLPAEGGEFRWIRELLEILEHAGNPEEFLEHTKLEMYQDQVFCFTPKGDVIALPRGATPVDFAYAVHTDVGDTCVGAKINGRIAPLRTAIENGDQLEIIRSKAQTPSPTWDAFVVTGKARAAIRRYVRDQQHSQYVDLGRAILERAFQQHGHELTEKALAQVLKVFRARDSEELYAKVGEGFLSGKDVVERIYPGEQPANAKPSGFARMRSALTRARSGQAKGGDHAVPIRGLIPGMAVHLATCCHPLPGDRIVGIVTTGKGVTVHTIDCESLENFTNVPESWLDISWDPATVVESIHAGRLTVTLTNEPGSLNALTAVVAKNMGNISNLRIADRSQDFFEIVVDIEVQDVKHLSNIMAALRADPLIHSVSRGRA